jgi:hypothetical protein
MTRTYTLTDEGMEAIRASESFQALHREQADMLEEILYDSFWGGNAIPREIVELRLDRMIENVLPEDGPGLRHVILDALGV